MAPLSKLEPCGPNLEYDPEYVVLVAKMAPKGDTQYGDFIGAAEAPNWGDIERDCRRMLLRSCDINIIVLLMRCRTRIAQAEGLREGLALLVASLEQYPDAIHPQATIEGEYDLTVRANALATLTDPEGLMADIREIIINKNSAMRLQVRDVERAFATPKPADALSASSVQQQLDDLYRQHDNNLAALSEVAHLLNRLQTWSITYLDDYASDLRAVQKLVGLFSRKDQPQNASISAPKKLLNVIQAAIAPPVEAANLPPSLPPSPMQTNSFELQDDSIQDRQMALQAMIKAREWFEQAEPSSPVSVLLRQAEKMVGKRFSEVVQCIPLELLERWEQEAK
ncbi:type VI secretion system protein TssA [Glaciimonas sp. GS1]|uniref:Type VI secretion system protein TssA n=1 Tax=Glaciimonas soli TaxID=2590999 RepID=A0A843YVT2_9BURK|nr:type VI secretion system protein TssA [Glaciimonas soli]